MKYQSAFKRYELKYLLSSTQYLALLSFLNGKIKEDKFAKSLIRNIYYDTPDYLLIRRSLDKPAYKEKLRVRSYGDELNANEYFVELKKKFDSVVYKRRYAERGSDFDATTFPNTAVGREIEYAFTRYDHLEPKMYLSYERLAYVLVSDESFRITFDTNILWRTFALSLKCGVGGVPILQNGNVLMELKTSGAIPLWLAEYFSANRIYKTNFSKYGEAYKALIKNSETLIKLKGDFDYARRYRIV